MNIKHTFICSALAIGWGVCASAQDGDFRSPMLGFFEAGVLCAPETNQTHDAPDTVAGSTHIVQQAPPFVSHGRVVPAVLGIGFGVRSGLVPGVEQDDVVMSISHPPFAGSGAIQQSFSTHIGAQDAPGITFYQFDHGYELALGEWTMTAIAGDVVIYEASFVVVPPSALPELANVCGFEDLIS